MDEQDGIARKSIATNKNGEWAYIPPPRPYLSLLGVVDGCDGSADKRYTVLHCWRCDGTAAGMMVGK